MSKDFRLNVAAALCFLALALPCFWLVRLRRTAASKKRRRKAMISTGLRERRRRSFSE